MTEIELKEELVLLLSPVYPLMQKIREVGGQDVFMDLLWIHGVGDCFVLSWRPMKLQGPVGIIRNFIEPRGGRITGCFDVAYPGEEERTGRALSFTIKDLWK